MPIKVTMFMAADRYSWSEAHYFVGGSDFVAATAPAQALAAARATLLGVGADLTGLRLSSVPANQLVEDISFDAGGSTGVWPADPTNQTWTTDRPFVSLLVRMASGLGHKNLYLAGIPDTIIRTTPGDPDGYTLVQPFTDRIYAYLDLMTVGGFAGAWGYRTRTSAGALQVSSIVTNALFPQTIGLVTPTTLDVVPGQSVYAKGWRRKNTRLPSLSGAWQVVGVIPPASGPGPYTYFLGGSGAVPTDNYIAMGTLAKLAYAYTAYTGHTIQRSAKRSRGGSYGLPRGRSKTKR